VVKKGKGTAKGITAHRYSLGGDRSGSDKPVKGGKKRKKISVMKCIKLQRMMAQYPNGNTPSAYKTQKHKRKSSKMRIILYNIRAY